MGSELEYERFKVALCQCSSVLGDEATDPRVPNLEKALERIKTAAALGAKLSVFGEIYLTGYETNEFFPRFATTLDPPDEEIKALISAAKEHDMYVIMGMTTRGRHLPGDLYNTTVLIGPEGFVGAYRKINVAAFWIESGGVTKLAAEKASWGSGREIPVFPTKLGNIGIHTCYDISFPEIARVQTLKGAHLLVNTSASVQGAEPIWDVLSPARAIENQIWYVVTSVVGKQKNFVLFGGSRVIDPRGNTVARCRDMEEDLVVAEIDYRKMLELRARSHYFNDRTPTLYQAITENYAQV